MRVSFPELAAHRIDELAYSTTRALRIITLQGASRV
jgi:hypothetical protein